MSGCMFVGLLKNEIQNLNRLVESLEDKSRFCFPNEYSCSECFREIIHDLQRIEKEAKETCELLSKYGGGVSNNCSRGYSLKERR